jgi:hypothetical protein
LKGIKKLSMAWCCQPTITDNAVSYLAGIAELNIAGCSQFTEEAFKLLQHVKTLNIAECTQFPDAAFAHLHDVVDLDISSCSQLTDAAFVHFGKLRTLKMVGCKQSAISDAAFGHLNGLKRLDMSQCNQATISSKALNSLHAIESLRMSSCNERIVGVQDFAAMSTLSELDIGGCNTQTLLNALVAYIQHPKLGPSIIMEVWLLSGRLDGQEQLALYGGIPIILHALSLLTNAPMPLLRAGWDAATQARAVSTVCAVLVNCITCREAAVHLYELGGMRALVHVWMAWGHADPTIAGRVCCAIGRMCGHGDMNMCCSGKYIGVVVDALLSPGSQNEVKLQACEAVIQLTECSHFAKIEAHKLGLLAGLLRMVTPPGNAAPVNESLVPAVCNTIQALLLGDPLQQQQMSVLGGWSSLLTGLNKRSKILTYVVSILQVLLAGTQQDSNVEEMLQLGVLPALSTLMASHMRRPFFCLATFPLLHRLIAYATASNSRAAAPTASIVVGEVPSTEGRLDNGGIMLQFASIGVLMKSLVRHHAPDSEVARQAQPLILLLQMSEASAAPVQAAYQAAAPFVTDVAPTKQHGAACCLKPQEANIMPI